VPVTLAYTNGAAPASRAPGHQQPAPTDGLARIKKSDCLACHAVEHASVGPSYIRVAQRYAGQPDARTRLMAKIVSGGSGVWGDRMMPPHPSLTTDDTRAMVEYILSLNVAAAKLPVRGLMPLTQHAAAPGGMYHLKATYADQPRNGIHSLADWSSPGLVDTWFS
jgi:cytochrome c